MLWIKEKLSFTKVTTIIILVIGICISAGCAESNNVRKITKNDVLNLINKHDALSEKLDLKGLENIYSKDFELILEEKSGELVRLDRKQTLTLFEAAKNLTNHNMTRNNVVVKLINNNKAIYVSHIVAEKGSKEDIDITKSKEVFYIRKNNKELKIFKVHSIDE